MVKAGHLMMRIASWKLGKEKTKKTTQKMLWVLGRGEDWESDEGLGTGPLGGAAGSGSGECH